MRDRQAEDERGDEAAQQPGTIEWRPAQQRQTIHDIQKFNGRHAGACRII